MTVDSRRRWAFVLCAWASSAALACGSSDSKSKKTSDAGSQCFDNVTTTCTSAQHGMTGTGGSKPAKPGSGPTKPSGKAMDSGTAMMDSDDGSVGSRGEPFDSGPLDASSDHSSNDEWIGIVEMLVHMTDRPSCDKLLQRDSRLDLAAEDLANDPNNTPELKTKSMWQRVWSSQLDDVLPQMRPFVIDNAPACNWRAYGIGIVGAPGGNRRIVLLLAE
jgi:hypothetical protein